MIHHIRYEFHKQATSFRGVTVTNAIVNLISLIFFSLVGHFEKSETHSILTDATGIMTLSATLTLSVAVIYGVIIGNKQVLKHYIGQAREQSFLFPNGRTTIFRNRLDAMCLHFLLSILPVLVFENLIFYAFANALRIELSAFLAYCLKMLVIAVFVSFFSLFLVVISLIVGQQLQSTTTSVISAILLVAIFGNIVAHFYTFDSLLIFVLAVCTSTSILLERKFLSHKIQKDDIITKVKSS